MSDAPQLSSDRTLHEMNHLYGCGVLRGIMGPNGHETPRYKFAGGVDQFKSGYKVGREIRERHAVYAMAIEDTTIVEA